MHVRVRRDADEQVRKNELEAACTCVCVCVCVQEVLSQVHTCMSSQMNDLTVQVMKDDLIIPAAPPTHIPVGVVSPHVLPLSPPHPHTHTHSTSHGHSHSSIVVNL